MPTGVPSTRAIAKVFFVTAAMAMALYLVYLIRDVVVLVFIAGFLAVALGPAVDLFARRRIPRGLAILLVYVCLGLVVFLVGLLIVPPVVGQVEKLSTDLPSYIDDLSKSATYRDLDDEYNITRELNEQAAQLPNRVGDAASTLQSITVGVLSATVALLTVLTMTFFLLLDGRRLVDFGLGLLGPREPRFRLVATEIYKSVSGYVAGALTIATIAGVSTYLMLSILGIEFAVPLAVLATFLGLIPLVGASIAGVIIGTVTLFTNFPTATIVYGIFVIVYQQLENNVLQPFVYRRTVNVAPLGVIVAILVGASLLGILGALVAIPLAATAQIIARDVWRRRTSDSTLTHGDPLDPVLPPADAPEVPTAAESPLA